MEVVSSMESWKGECGRRDRGIRGRGGPSMWGEAHGFREEGPELPQVVGKTTIARGAKEVDPPTPLENGGVSRARERPQRLLR